MPTVRVYHAGGQGYTDTTTNSSGDVIGTATYSEEGVVTQHTETDPATGTTKTTKYKNGKPDTSETTNREGDTLQKEIFNDNGQVVDATTYDNENFTSERETYDYDENGNMTQSTKHGSAGEVTETTVYDYDENGNLRKATRSKHNENGELEPVDSIEYDENGNVVGSEGNTDGIINDRINKKLGDSKTHVTPGPDDTTISVTHNPDGTFEVVVKDKYGRIISQQHLSKAGGCYLGGDCPFHKTEKTSHKPEI